MKHDILSSIHKTLATFLMSKTNKMDKRWFDDINPPKKSLFMYVHLFITLEMPKEIFSAQGKTHLTLFVLRNIRTFADI